MSESDKGVLQSQKETGKKRPLKKRIAYTTAAVGAAVVGAFAADQPISAETPTPTVTATKPAVSPTAKPTLTLTPDTEMNREKAKIEELRRQRELAYLKATQTALAEEINTIKGTPTKMPKPTETPTSTATGTSTPTRTPTEIPPATPTFTQWQTDQMQKAGLLPTYTPTPGSAYAAPTESVPGNSQKPGQESGVPGGNVTLGIGGALLGLGLLYGFRQQIGVQLGRGANWTRGRASDLWHRIRGGEPPAAAEADAPVEGEGEAGVAGGDGPHLGI